VGGVSEVPEPGPGAGAVPVDEHPPVSVADQVPRGQVVVAHQFVPVSGDRHVPARRGWWGERLGRVVQPADQAAQPGELRDRQRRLRLRVHTGDELEDLTARVIQPEVARTRVEPDGEEVFQEGGDRGGRRCCRLPHGLPDPDHRVGDVPAGQDLFVVDRHPSVSARSGPVSQDITAEVTLPADTGLRRERRR